MPVPAGGTPPSAPLSGPLVYDPVLSRVQITISGLVDIVPFQVQRSTNQITWVTVRGGSAKTPVGGVLQLDDYEFSPDVINYYRVRGPVVFDDFARTVADGWSSANSGQAYTNTGGLSTEYDVTGGVGTHTHATAVDLHRSNIASIGSPDFGLRVDMTIAIGAAVGAPFTARVAGRRTDDNNYYDAQLFLNTDSTVSLAIAKRVTGTLTVIAALVPVGTHAGGNTWRVVFEGAGTSLRAMAWNLTTASEPTGWTVTATDSSLTTGNGVALHSRRETGNTNTGPVMAFDNLVVYTPDVAIFDGSITPVLDGVWLKSLARPFLNRKVTVVDYSDVERASRGGVFPIVGRSFPVAVTDLHGSRQWTLDVLAETAQEAEDLDLLVSTGEVQFVHVPAAERVPGGYVALGNTTERRPGRRSTRRVFSMPFTECAAPGPDVIPAVGTWQSVLNTYATWADVLAAHPTWQDLLNLVGSPADVVVP